MHRKLEKCNELRRLVSGRIRAQLLALRGAVIGPKVTVGRNCRFDKPWTVRIGERVVLEDSVYLKVVADDAALEIGAHTFIGRGSEFDVQQAVSVGDHTLIAPGCFITDHNHAIAADLKVDEQGIVSKAVVIGNDVWLGARVTVVAGVKIGDGAVIGAHAVVTKDVPPMAVAAGVPARVLRYRERERSTRPYETASGFFAVEARETLVLSE